MSGCFIKTGVKKGDHHAKSESELLSVLDHLIWKP